MRIIAGTAKGRRIAVPKGNQTRPTSDRVREALFSILGPPPDQAHVADLFAGTGGLGLEAVSRGAQHCVFVERDKRAMATLKSNVQSLGFTTNATLVEREVSRSRAELQHRGPYYWIFIDPPYAGGYEEMALRLAAGLPLADQATIILEHDRRNQPPEAVESISRCDVRKYGDTSLSLYRRIEQG